MRFFWYSVSLLFLKKPIDSNYLYNPASNMILDDQNVDDILSDAPTEETTDEPTVSPTGFDFDDEGGKHGVGGRPKATIMKRDREVPVKRIKIPFCRRRPTQEAEGKRGGDRERERRTMTTT